MSAKIITDTSRVKPDVSARVWDLYVDGEIIPGIPPGTITPGANNTFLRTNNLGLVQWNPFTLSDIPHGATGTVLSSNGSAISWQIPTINPSQLVPGSPGQVLVMIGGTAGFSDDIDLPGLLNVTGVTTLQSSLIAAGPSFLSGATTVNTLTSNGLITAASENIVGNLQFNSNSGSIGDIITKTGATTQQWATPTNVRCIRYVTYFASQNLNAGVGLGPIPIVFDNVNVISNYSAGSSTSVAGISQPDTTSFLIGTLGAYDIDITGYCSGAGIGNSGFAITAEVNGTEIYRSIVSNYRGSIFTGKLPSILISAGSTLKLLTTSIAGAGALSTNAPLSAFPNYSSTIAISLVNTV